MFIDINKLVGFKNIKEKPKIAKVINNNDPTQKARIKIEIPGIFEATDSTGSNLPWVRQEGSSFNGVQQFQVPDVGSLVELNWKFGSRIPTYKPAPYECNNYNNKFTTDYPYCWGWADDNGFALIIDRKAKTFTLTCGSTSISGDGTNINISGGNVTIGDNTTIDGKVFLNHTHSGVTTGSGTTGGVV